MIAPRFNCSSAQWIMFFVNVKRMLSIVQKWTNFDRIEWLYPEHDICVLNLKKKFSHIMPGWDLAKIKRLSLPCFLPVFFIHIDYIFILGFNSSITNSFIFVFAIFLFYYNWRWNVRLALLFFFKCSHIMCL